MQSLYKFFFKEYAEPRSHIEAEMKKNRTEKWVFIDLEENTGVFMFHEHVF